MTAFDDALGGLSTADWEGISANRLYSSHQWLGLLAQDGATTGAVHGRTSGGELAALPVTVVADEPNPFYRWHDELTARGLAAPASSGVLAGPRRGYQTHLLTAPGTDPVAAAEAVLAGLAELAGVAVGAPRVAMFLDTASVVALRSAGVRAMPVLLRPDAWLPVPDGDWDTWLASLPSRSRAELVRREVRKFAKAGYEVTEHPLADWTDVAGRLLTNTEARYGHSGDPTGRQAFLRRQAERLGPAARVLLCAPPGEPPLGYCLYYLWGDTLFLRSAGFDYDRLRNAAEYFNLVYYLPVRIAAAAGARWIHAGVEASEAKAMRGAVLRPLWMLDLSPDSVLAGQDDALRAANAEQTRKIVGSSSAARRAWQPAAECDDFGVTPAAELS
ncbi:peptidogalycan biosysnthesis protein [Amycolatopsis sp. CA-126428]|uniref:peptidogalycan biosysnthesis protein n=1 Tax=Amycolatopsis sp. CA-126428 TaxID=2073158 RepID=UPI000CD1CEBB|nr:peptidogalycan biosysnthesis protein [Amycolatopsis sp. CA-126428]